MSAADVWLEFERTSESSLPADFAKLALEHRQILKDAFESFSRLVLACDIPLGGEGAAKVPSSDFDVAAASAAACAQASAKTLGTVAFARPCANGNDFDNEAEIVAAPNQAEKLDAFAIASYDVDEHSVGIEAKMVAPNQVEKLGAVAFARHDADGNDWAAEPKIVTAPSAPAWRTNRKNSAETNVITAPSAAWKSDRTNRTDKLRPSDISLEDLEAMHTEAMRQEEEDEIVLLEKEIFSCLPKWRILKPVKGCIVYYLHLQEPERTGFLAKLTRSTHFEIVCLAVIIFNAWIAEIGRAHV